MPTLFRRRPSLLTGQQYLPGHALPVGVHTDSEAPSVSPDRKSPHVHPFTGSTVYVCAGDWILIDERGLIEVVKDADLDAYVERIEEA
jgi:hypothetical protein